MTESSISKDRDRHSFLSSLLFSVAFGALAMFYMVVLYHLLYHHRLHGVYWWFAPSDIWQVIDGGRLVWHGSLGYVYGGTNSYALPLSFILAAPVSAIIDHFHLIENIIPLPRPTAYLVAGPFALLFNVFLLDAVRRLAWTLGMRSRLWLLQLATVFIVMVPGFQWGHFEDIIALTFVLHAARYILAKDYLRAALLISLAVSSKQWALMLIPFVFFAAPAGQRLRALGAACALPLAFVLLFFGVDFHHAADALLSPVNEGRNTPGHIVFYVTWLGKKTSQLTRTAGVLISPIIAWRFRRVESGPAVLAAMGILVLIRPFSEAINYSYYWSPALIFFGLSAVARYQRFRVRDWVLPAAAIAWTLPHGNPRTSTEWWIVQLFLLAGIGLQVASNCGIEIRLSKIATRVSRKPHTTRDLDVPVDLTSITSASH